jgi:hypothetical protein
LTHSALNASILMSARLAKSFMRPDAFSRQGEFIFD